MTECHDAHHNFHKWRVRSGDTRPHQTINTTVDHCCLSGWSVRWQTVFRNDSQSHMESLTQDWHLETFRRNWLWGDNCQANICDRWADWWCRDSNINKTKKSVDAAAKIQLNDKPIHRYADSNFLTYFTIQGNSLQPIYLDTDLTWLTDWLTDRVTAWAAAPSDMNKQGLKNGS